MHRHHPYGGGGYDERRRSASPGPRFPRSERGFGYRGSGRGGRGRGRGGGFGGYDSGPTQSFDPYEQGGADPSATFNGGNQSFAPYNGGSPAPFGRGGGGAGAPASDSYGGQYDNDWSEDRGPRRRRERDDKVHDAIIEERINRERPCRTLFVRNIKYESDSNAIRRQFEEHGQIKTFFDLIHTRGMVFVTFYDLRSAQAARERLQGTEVAGRPIDVHYSLPRGDEQAQRCDRDKNQGTLLVTLRNSTSPMDENEVRRKFQQFGDVKGVRPVPGRIDQRYVEMYDTRATNQAFDTLRHQGLQDGVMDLEFAWDFLDEHPPEISPLPPRSSFSREPEDTFNRPPRAPSRGRGRGRGGYDDYDRRDRDYGGRDEWVDDDRGYSSGRGRGYRGGPPGGGRGGYGSSDQYEDRHDSSYGRGNSSYAGNASASGPPAVDDRLEQARKVQQLLAALKNPQDAAATSTAPPVPQAPQPRPASSFNPPTGPSFHNSNYAAPPTAAPTGPTGGWPPAAATYAAAGTAPPSYNGPSQNPPPGLASLPPAVLALLQQTQQQAQVHAQHIPAPPPPAPAPYYPSQPPPQAQYNPPPSASAPLPSGSAPNPQAMQQLLALLTAQQQKR